MAIKPCNDCKRLPTMSPEYIGFSLICECYDPTPNYSEGPPNTAYSEFAETKQEVIEDWNDNWGVSNGQNIS